MKKCIDCNSLFESDDCICPNCGSNQVVGQNDVAILVCPFCGTSIKEADAVFCPNCGNKLIDVDNEKINDNINKMSGNEFVKSLKEDVKNSQSINMIKEKVGSSAEKAKLSNVTPLKKYIIIFVAFVIVIIGIFFNIHTCEECDKTFFGKKYTINYWGETETVCRDCYEYFYFY